MRKWLILAVAWLGFTIMAVNWFNISVAFGPIGEELHIGIAELALLISVFLVGVGLFHIPAGILATRLGLRTALTLGLAVEGVGASLSALASGYAQLLLFRVLTGFGASIFICIGIAAVSVWFREKQLAFALGLLSTGYCVGTTLGLYTWADVTNGLGWRGALALGGVLCLVISVLVMTVYKSPPGNHQLAGVKVTGRALRTTLGNKQLWLYGIAFMGTYGAFFVASQMIGEYGATERHLDPGQMAFAMLALGLAGIPGSVIGGWLSDRLGRRKTIVLQACVLHGLFLLAVPFTPPGLLWILAAGVGFLFNGGWAVWQCVPGSTPGVSSENIGTAIGLMLTVTSIGGFVIPFAFGHIVEALGYSAAWIFLGAVSVLSAAVGLAAREPDGAEVSEIMSVPEVSPGSANS